MTYLHKDSIIDKNYILAIGFNNNSVPGQDDREFVAYPALSPALKSEAGQA